MAKENGGSRSQKTVRVLVVDDHPMLRERLAEVINSERDLTVCGEAEDHHQALEAIENCKPDLIILDLHLRRSSGFDLIKDVQARHPALRILVVSMYEELLYAERALRAGAHGYITKQNASKDILGAIRKVLAGEVYMSEALAVRIACKVTGHRQHQDVTPDQLSDRELRVFELIGEGCRVREIAEQMHLDPKTVETYRMRIKEKLDLTDANEVLKQAIQWTRTLAGS